MKCFKAYGYHIWIRINILRVAIFMFFKLGLLFCFLFVGVAYGAEKTTPTILYSKESPYGLIEVVRDPDSGALDIYMGKNYNTIHSSILPDDATDLSYLQYEIFATAGFCFTKSLQKVLLLGLGGGSFLTYMNNYFSTTYIDAVDINPVMFEIIEKFRKFDARINKFICEDAFKYIENVKGSYDLIYCDVYADKPLTAEKYKDFFKKLKEHLDEGGVFVWNAYVPEISRVIVEDMFKNFQNVTATITEDGFNIVFICYQGPTKTKEDLEEAANHMQTQYNFRYALPDLMKKIRLISPGESKTWIMKFLTLG
ncbi:MAG: methyltransferase domain-containing protein [Alphaproteobacteria bacterium]|nr:methyltransferase domain-containing protein [Alphaproteobacteria bacterium]